MRGRTVVLFLALVVLGLFFHLRQQARLSGVSPPKVALTPAARAKVRQYLAATNRSALRLTVNAANELDLQADAERPDDVVVDEDGFRLVLDQRLAARAEGVIIDYTEGAQVGFVFTGTAATGPGPAASSTGLVLTPAAWVRLRGQSEGTIRFRLSQKADGRFLLDPGAAKRGDLEFRQGEIVVVAAPELAKDVAGLTVDVGPDGRFVFTKR